MNEELINYIVTFLFGGIIFGAIITNLKYKYRYLITMGGCILVIIMSIITIIIKGELP